ncbi:hypothetical protein HX021_06690 [Sphingobacterium sp. N143]|uniref:hypothetical protein n=1 Tax=Sphingobacterium sp. N143 TaxID=2746727 RepID=UPI0025774934|nr:hypothetical protein [Sphingobacterium sp. N143]MDM1293981.1 hypothetical protein [Sphingobacterium sp. N143]
MEETFTHVRTMISIILGFSVAQLLKNGVKLIDHNKILTPYPLHLLWVVYSFLLIIHFWWWEARLKDVVSWNFLEYLFLILYTAMYYALSVLIFPDSISEYKGFKDYFFSRKKWFFSFLIVIFITDFADTLLKGRDYFTTLHWEYPLRNAAHILLCIAGIRYSNIRFQYLLAILFILYEFIYIWRHYFV